MPPQEPVTAPPQPTPPTPTPEVPGVPAPDAPAPDINAPGAPQPMPMADNGMAQPPVNNPTATALPSEPEKKGSKGVMIAAIAGAVVVVIMLAVALLFG